MIKKIIDRLATRVAAQKYFIHMGMGALTLAISIWLDYVNTAEDIRIIIGLMGPIIVIAMLSNHYICLYFHGENL